jgi:hypothetical protein
MDEVAHRLRIEFSERTGIEINMREVKDRDRFGLGHAVLRETELARAKRYAVPELTTEFEPRRGNTNPDYRVATIQLFAGHDHDRTASPVHKVDPVDLAWTERHQYGFSLAHLLKASRAVAAHARISRSSSSSDGCPRQRPLRVDVSSGPRPTVDVVSHFRPDAISSAQRG